MKVNTLILPVFTLFLMMLIGFIVRKNKLLNNELNRGLNDLIINVTAPATIIMSFNLQYSSKTLHNIGIFFISCIIVHLTAFLIGKLLFVKYPLEIRKLFRFATIFSNCGYMGLPVLYSIYGKTGVFYGSIYIATYNFLVWSVGVMIFAGKADRGTIKHTVTNPAILAVLAGLVLFISSFSLPKPIYQCLESIGNMTTPLAMMVIGSMLADIKLTELFSGFSVYYLSLTRLLIVPLLGTIILKLLRIPLELIKICITSAAMPVAATTVIFSEKYHNDPLFASRVVFISTALSLITIPLILMAVTKFA